MAGEITRKRFSFSGYVQGVGFRWRARQAASAAGCTGWVRNDYVGTVSMELQGTEAQLDHVLRTLESTPWIRIEDINSRLIPVEPDERGFVTRDDEW